MGDVEKYPSIISQSSEQEFNIKAKPNTIMTKWFNDFIITIFLLFMPN